MSRESGASILQRRNDDHFPLLLWLEPWAEEYSIPPESTLQIRMRGTADGEPEVDEVDGRITIYAPAGALVDVFINGVAQDSWSAETPAFDMGPLGTRGAIDVLFRNFPEARPGGAPLPQSGWRERLRRIWRR